MEWGQKCPPFLLPSSCVPVPNGTIGNGWERMNPLLGENYNESDMMNRLKTFWTWYKAQGRVTLNQWHRQKFRPATLVYLSHGASIATFLIAWPIFGHRHAMFLSGSVLVFLSAVFSLAVMASFLFSPFERLYADRQRQKSDTPKNW